MEIIVADEIKRLKNEIKSLRKSHNKPDVAKEDLLTFEMLDRYQHVVQQQEWPWRWENVDALYTFTDHISAWVVDDSVMAIWASGRQGLPNSFANWDSPEKETGMALMLSRGPSCLGEMTDLEGENVYFAVVVFVHPRQELLSIKEGAGCLVAIVEQAERSNSSSGSEVTVLCELPKHTYGRFYPSAVNDAYLVLPYTGMKENRRSFTWTIQCAPTATSWFVGCTGGRENSVTLRSYCLCSPRTLLSRSCFQSDTSVSCGSMRSSPRQLWRVAAD